jgi:hypothetical protein
MEKNNTHTTTTALAIFFVATAVVLIGGLTIIPTTTMMQTAFADPGGQPNVTYCHIPPGNPDNAHEVTAGAPSVEAHVREHGDNIGACQPNP